MVIGLGRFGTAVAFELNKIGHEVLAIDQDERRVQDVADEVTHAAVADATDEDTLRAFGIADFDCVIVGVSGVEVSVLTCVLLKRLGARRVVAKAASVLHAEILGQVGADRVVFPEREMGVRMAHSFAAPAVSDYLDVAPGYGLARITPGPEMVGKRLADVDLRGRFGLTPLVLRRGQQVIVNPDRDELLKVGDDLIVAGDDERLAQFNP
jgi:trk system potassium uptake protein TrkA